MTEHSFSSDELRVLTNTVCDGSLTEADAARLEQLLHGNADAQQFYLTHVCLERWLRWEFARQVQEPTLPCSQSPVLTLLGGAMHSTVGYFSSGWPVAYLVATVVLGLGLLIGNVTHVSQSVQVAHKSVPLPSPLSSLPSLPSFVGRITGMVDCQWADPSTVAFSGASVPLGRKYALASGLMEITYNTGAKVILQGPATYEVESPASGFLSVGKLTASVEKKEERRTKNEELPDSRSSFLIPHSYFAVRTPTAIVTDLGTEFGVEVNKEGNTSSHVFRGSVQVQLAAHDGQQGQTIQLSESESVRIGNGKDARVDRGVVDSMVFVRAIAQSPKIRPTRIIADDFSYPDGPLEGNNGGMALGGGSWSGAWFRSGTVNGGQVAIPETSAATRLFKLGMRGNTPRPIYFSARFTKTGANPDYSFCLRLTAGMNDSNDDYDDATIGLAHDRHLVYLGGGASDRIRKEEFGTYTPGQKVLIVGKLEFNVDGVNERLQAWIDPTGTEVASVMSSQIMADLGWTVPHYVHLRNWTGRDGSYLIDDLRIGDTWEAVVGSNNTSTSMEK